MSSFVLRTFTLKRMRAFLLPEGEMICNVRIYAVENQIEYIMRMVTELFLSGEKWGLSKNNLEFERNHQETKSLHKVTFYFFSLGPVKTLLPCMSLVRQLIRRRTYLVLNWKYLVRCKTLVSINTSQLQRHIIGEWPEIICCDSRTINVFYFSV